MTDICSEYDVIIAGAGPAGCVLAARLSEDGTKRVLLIEAGPDVIPGSEHTDILDPFALSATGNPAFHWNGLVAEVGVDPGDGSARASSPYLQARCVGGASNINGMAADRGQPEDYDSWEQLGAQGWGWKDVLPYFNKLEKDLDFPPTGLTSMHGSNGPMPVRRMPRSQWAPFAGVVGEALQRRGFRWLDDYNADFAEGFSSVPTNCLTDRRMSASMAYLTQEARSRPNLSILANAEVHRLSLAGRRVEGVLVRLNGKESLICAKEVIVSCGAIQSPVLLMRSGIGPSDHLAVQGVDVVLSVPGVGANLQNHPCVTLITYLPRIAAQPRDNVWFLQNWLRYTSHVVGCKQNDMHLMAFNKCAWHGLGSRVGAICVSVLNSYSRGTVQLSGGEHPRVKFNFLDDVRDSERLIKGLRLALELLADARVAQFHHEIFTPSASLVASLNDRNPWNRFKAAVITWALDRGPLRRRLLAASRIDPAHLLGSPDAMREFVRNRATMHVHVCGTCRMGAADDPNAVVDETGKVRGIEGLRVADASILPTAPRGYTHFIVIMAAEKIADAIKSEWRRCDAEKQPAPVTDFVGDAGA